MAVLGQASSPGASDGLAVVVFLGLLFLGFFLYFLPSFIALIRKTPNSVSILIINFFLGWTLIGWVVALAMASRTVPESQPAPQLGATSAFLPSSPIPQPSGVSKTTKIVLSTAALLTVVPLVMVFIVFAGSSVTTSSTNQSATTRTTQLIGTALSSLMVGSCVPDLDEPIQPRIIIAQCSGPHAGEVFAVTDMDDTDGCDPDFESYVGIPYEESQLVYRFLYDGIGNVACVIETDGIGGSVKGWRK